MKLRGRLMMYLLGGVVFTSFQALTAAAAPPEAEGILQGGGGGGGGGQDVVVRRGERAADDPAAPGAAVMMRQHRVTDPGMNGQIAATLLVPRGWTIEGGLSRTDLRLTNMPVMLDLQVTAPDGRQVHLYPNLTFEWVPSAPGQPFEITSNGNFYLAPPESIGQFLLALYQANPVPGVADLRLVVDEPAAELTQEVRKAAAPFYELVAQMPRDNGVVTQFDTQVSRAVFTYRQGDQLFEETFFVCWQYFVVTMNGQVFSGNWSINNMRSSRGRPGTDYLRDPVLTAVFHSLRVDPQWQQEMDRYWAELSRTRARGSRVAMEESRKRAELTRKTTEYVNNQMNETWKYGQNLRDATNEDVSDVLLDQIEYNTTNGQTVKLPSFYEHVYTDGDGNYLLHNDVSWDPNRDLSINDKPWERIERTP